MGAPTGTDQYGRDVFLNALQGLAFRWRSLSLYSLPVSSAVSAASSRDSSASGRRPWIMRFTDMIFAIPTVLFALAIVTALGPSILDNSIAIGVGWVPIFVRVVRSPVLALPYFYLDAPVESWATRVLDCCFDIFADARPASLPSRPAWRWRGPSWPKRA